MAADGIRVNAVAPAVVDTPIYNTFLAEAEAEAEARQALARFHSFHPLGRHGEAGDVAAAVLFLASSETDWITGVVLPVDGGVMAGRN